MSIQKLLEAETISSEQTVKPTKIKLGLIGLGVGHSSSPRLHQIAGAMYGLDLSYDLIDLQEHDPACFETVLARCAAEGYRGVNVTYPFKERVARVVDIASPAVKQIGSVNTVIFGKPPQGYNTDYTGFLRAWTRRFGDHKPGAVGLVGTGGVGKAIAFGLLELDARELRLYDLSLAKANALATSLKQTSPHLTVCVCRDLYQLTEGVDGLVNCTPVGMYQHPGTPIPPALIQGQRWAFDVVYTPLETAFLAAARAQGLALLNGYELFFYQGVDAFEYFTGIKVDESRLRLALEVGQMNQHAAR